MVAVIILQRIKVLVKVLVAIVKVDMVLIPIILIETTPCMPLSVGSIILIIAPLGIDAGNGTSVGLVQRQEN